MPTLLLYALYVIILQRIRERLIRDFGFIDHLCPEPRLISDSCDPSMLGASKGEAGICQLTTISY